MANGKLFKIICALNQKKMETVNINSQECKLLGLKESSIVVVSSRKSSSKKSNDSRLLLTSSTSPRLSIVKTSIISIEAKERSLTAPSCPAEMEKTAFRKKMKPTNLVRIGRNW